MRHHLWIATFALAVATGTIAGSVWSFFETAAINRSDPFLIGIGWFAVAGITVFGMKGISDLFADSTKIQEPKE